MSDKEDEKKQAPADAEAAGALKTGEAASDADAAPTRGPWLKRRVSWTHRSIVAALAALVVVAVLGSAAWTWHEQPGFCSAICHSSMQAYVDTYYAQLGQKASDKWGNEVSDASGMLAAAHRTDGLVCIDCHIPTIPQQVGEVVATVTGNYYSPLTETDLFHLQQARGLPEDQFCLRSGCHDMTREELEAKTSSWSFNPHSSQHGNQDCSSCHKAHRASVYTCTRCHSEAEVPAGWLSWDQAQKLDNTAV